ncbi:MAG TPA: hypothetical protein VGG75_30735, partial [Trebonia sp.]
LRHGAAALLLAAGHEMKVVRETLGLSSITIAADTCISILPRLARRGAEDVAALIRPGEPARTAETAPCRPAVPNGNAPIDDERPGRGGRSACRPGRLFSSVPIRGTARCAVPRGERPSRAGSP